MLIQWKDTEKRVWVMTVSLFLLAVSSVGVFRIYTEQKQAILTEKTQLLDLDNRQFIPGTPKRLIIPEINIDTIVTPLGVTDKNEMEVPTNSVEVGWFKYGVRPGEIGSAVIAGHLDQNNGKAGIFENLRQLKTGDNIYIEDENGKVISFKVKESKEYNPGYAEDVFNKNDTAYLNLITCDGTWDKSKNSYSKRLVVFSEKNTR